MATHLYLSTRIEDLADRLADKLAVPGGDPFAAPLVLVPNANLRKWLWMRIADHGDVAMNLEFYFLENPEFWRKVAGGDWTWLDATDRQLLLFAALLRSVETDPALEPFRRYIDHGAEAARPGRLWQLAEKVGKLFREYTYHRSGMLDRWADGGHVAPGNAMERCQAALWRLVFAPGGMLERLNGAATSERRDLRDLLKVIQMLSPGDGNALHVFGFSHVSHFHHGIIKALGASREVYFYHLNPYAGDLTPVDQATLPGMEAIDETPGSLRKRWSKPALDVRHMFGLDGVEPEVLGGQPAQPASVLEALQAALTGATGLEARPQDDTLQLVGCPGLWREVEMVHDGILHNLAADATLRVSDIAVLVTDMRRYRPVLESVFSRGERLLPWNLSDSNAAEESLYGRAVTDLFALADGAFTRREVFAVVMNPCFLAAAGATRDDALAWLEWADRLGVYRYFGAEDRAAALGPGGDRHTWTHGLTRLRLGRVLDAPPEFPQADWELDWRGVVPYADLESADQERVAGFSAAVERLAAAVRLLRRGPRPAGRWRMDIAGLAADLFAVPAERTEETLVQFKFNTSLDRLAILDETGATPAPALGHVRAFLQATLAEIPRRKGSYLGGGVTISSLLPMRPIPFRLVYVLGLGEGLFPGTPDLSTLDLRTHDGFVDGADITVPETNRSLFLETILSVRRRDTRPGKLVLSWVNRELAKDQELFPCSTVNELLRYVEAVILGGAAFRPHAVPLAGEDARYLQAAAGDAPADIQAHYTEADRLLALAALDRERGSGAADFLDRGQRAAFERKRAAWEEKLAGLSLSGVTPASARRPEVERITIAELKRFLENPATAVLRRHLGLYADEAEDKSLREDEPFFSVFPHDYRWHVDLLAGFAADGDFDAALDLGTRRYAHLSRTGATPTGGFAEADLAGLVRRARAQLTAGSKGAPSLQAFLADRRAAGDVTVRDLVLGETTEEVARPVLCPPLAMEVDGRAVRLTGRQELVFRQHDGGAHALVFTTGGFKLKHLVAPWLFLTALRAGVPAHDFEPERAFAVSVSAKDGVHTTVYPAGTAEAARAWLAGLVRGLLDSGAVDLIPFDLACEVAAKRYRFLDGLHGLPTAAEREALARAFTDRVNVLEENDSEYASYRPDDTLRLVNPAVPADLYDKLRDRLLPIVPALGESAAADGEDE